MKRAPVTPKEQPAEGPSRVAPKRPAQVTTRKKPPESPPSPDAEALPLRGAAARIAENMEASLALPTATSNRSIPVKLLEENRRIINEHLATRNRGRVSYSHIVAWALIQALRDFPSLNASLATIDGTPHRLVKRAINLGVAVDLERKDGTRSLVVPNIKNAEKMSFQQFLESFNDLVQRTRKGTIEASDFQDTTITLTNPGTVGTIASQPRLMVGQGAIIATGAIGYPAEYHAMAQRALAHLGISKVMNISCTYDHRVIQGAESGRFLGRMHDLLLGEDGFYERIFEDLRLSDRPVQWALDHSPSMFGGSASADALEKQAGVLQLINLYRVRGHLIANLDPLGDHPFYHPDLDPAT